GRPRRNDAGDGGTARSAGRIAGDHARPARQPVRLPVRARPATGVFAEMIRHLLALGCCALLGACSALTGPRSEYVVFTLNPAPASETVSSETASTEPTEADWVLAIDEPHALGLLDTDRLVVAPDANERLAFAGVRWNERTPVLL